MSKSLKRVRAAIEAAGLDTTILEMPGGTRTAADASREAGCEIDQIAKSIIFRGETTGNVVLFITAGGRQVDPVRAAALAGEALGRADADFVRQTTGFAIGGVAPLGHLTEPRIFFDRTLLGFETVYAAAGTPRHIFSVEPRALQRICDAQVSDFIS
ncbi:YbaK/EbsC family protein [Alphaproteobacteria bacterium GH1-50]|uniref:YbaK/EbsC family protein n=1 Tax=Kangsaoukella pontilimi TaxID=2691042 RepID=A0A7C9IMY2_9RHOB|nr:YbaK/EbsC family protein [Kangsaoukella pontilimi]MXQ06970.1 YbaK/EbsC family protein [Kangsaoukella pontilimi]